MCIRYAHFEQSNLHRTDPDVVAINCIASECASFGVRLYQEYKQLAERWDALQSLNGLTLMITNVTGDERLLEKFCMFVASLFF